MSVKDNFALLLYFKIYAFAGNIIRGGFILFRDYFVLPRFVWFKLDTKIIYLDKVYVQKS